MIPEILRIILSFLPLNTMNFFRVCKTWSKIPDSRPFCKYQGFSIQKYPQNNKSEDRVLMNRINSFSLFRKDLFVSAQGITTITRKLPFYLEDIAQQSHVDLGIVRRNIDIDECVWTFDQDTTVFTKLPFDTHTDIYHFLVLYFMND